MCGLTRSTRIGEIVRQDLFAANAFDSDVSAKYL
jgi:hypothetical protein